MEHIETVIIGAGQAGLSTAYHLKRRAATASSSTATSASATAGGSSGTACGSTPPRKYDGLPGMPFPGEAVVVPGQGRPGRLPRGIRAPLRPAGPARRPRRTSCRTPSRRPASSSTPTTGRTHVRQRRGRDRHLRPHAVGARLREGPRPVDPAAALQRVPPPRPAPRRPRPRRRRVPLRLRHRLRGRRDPADDARRPRLRADPGPARVPTDAGGLAGAARSCGGTWSRGVRRSAARRWRRSAFHGGPMLRVKRSDLAERGVVRNESAGRGRARRAPGARRRHRRRRRQRGLGDRLPAGLRLDRPAGLRRGRLARGVPRRLRRRARPVLLRPVASSTPSPPCWSAAAAATRSTSPADRRRAPRAGRATLAPAAWPDHVPGTPREYRPNRRYPRWACWTTWRGLGRTTSAATGRPRSTAWSGVERRRPRASTTSRRCADRGVPARPPRRGRRPLPAGVRRSARTAATWRRPSAARSTSR